MFSANGILSLVYFTCCLAKLDHCVLPRGRTILGFEITEMFVELDRLHSIIRLSNPAIWTPIVLLGPTG